MNRLTPRPIALGVIAALAACSTPPVTPPVPTPPNTFESAPLPNAVTPGFDQADPVDAVRERFEQNLSGPSVPLPVPGDADDAPGPALDDDLSGAIVGKNLITGDLTTRAAVPADSPVPLLPAPDIPDLEPGAAPSSLRPQGGALLDRVTFLSRAQTQRVKLESSFPNRSPSGSYGCSGTLIDSQWLITAAHCVYHFDEVGSAQNGYAGTVRVMPGYRNGSETTTGSAFATDILVRSGWRERGDYDDDIAWVKLDRHIGGISGFHTFSYSTDCNHFKNNTFVSHGYPSESPYDGDDMFGGSFNFDKCDVNSSGTWFDYDVRVNAPSFGGQSGSGAVTPAASPQLGGIVWGVLSRSDRATRTTYTRLTRGKALDIGVDIYNSTPKGFDLVPQRVQFHDPPRISLPSSVQPSRSDALNPRKLTPGTRIDLAFNVFNASYERFRGNIAYSVYLSSNKAVTKGDTFLGSFVATDVELNSKTARFVFNRGSIRVPSCRPGSGTNYIGVIVANPDAVTHNNDSSFEEALPVEMPGASLCP